VRTISFKKLEKKRELKFSLHPNFNIFFGIYTKRIITVDEFGTAVKAQAIKSA